MTLTMTNVTPHTNEDEAHAACSQTFHNDSSRCGDLNLVLLDSDLSDC